MADLDALRADDRRLWTTSYIGDEREALVDRIEGAGFELVEARTWTGAWVDLYEPAHE